MYLKIGNVKERGTVGPGANVFEKCEGWLSWEEGLGGNLTM